MKRGIRAGIALAVAAGSTLAGCERERPPLPGTEGGGPAVTGSAASGPIIDAVEEGEPLALKLEGIGSRAELQRAAARIEDPELRATFEAGFRSCFVYDRAQRNYALAAEATAAVVERIPDFAPAYRVLAYARLNSGSDMAGVTSLYERAVELDPDYGEAHYALAFMLTQSDPEQGRRHFERARELGVPDERGLRERFYP